MLGGGGLMIMQPALPAFFLGELSLSYTTLAIALAACKGIGFTLTSRLWAGLLNKLNIFRFSSHVTILAALLLQSESFLMREFLTSSNETTSWQTQTLLFQNGECLPYSKSQNFLFSLNL